MRIEYSVPLVFAAVILSTSPALAEGFDGPFVGVQAGYEYSELQGPETELGVVTLDDSTDAFTGGLFFGYDKQVGSQFVVGVEGGIDFAADNDVVGTIGTTAASIEPQWSLDLTARAGYLLDQDNLIYVRGGYEYADVDVVTASATGAELANSESRNGWVVGAGFERHLTDNLVGRVEYRYSDLSEGDGTWDRHRALLGVSYRF